MEKVEKTIKNIFNLIKSKNCQEGTWNLEWRRIPTRTLI